jgi:hypothetical protein
MEKSKTYLELLAENDEEARKEFEPNAKELFIDHNEYEDDVEAHGKEHDELEDQEAFQRYGGSHQQASKLGEIHENVAKQTTAVEYDKAVCVHVISIDSRFRSNVIDNPSNFFLKLLAPIKNVVSIRLSSLEIPNTWYTFSNIRGNTSVDVLIQDGSLLDSFGQPVVLSLGRIVIPEGNYTLDTTTQNCLQTILATQLNATFTTLTFTVVISPISGLLTISCVDKIVTTNKIKFQLDFTQGLFSSRDFNFGLGYNLGFRNKKTSFQDSHTSEQFPDVNDSNYIFLNLNPDWKVVSHRNPDRTITSSFAKVIVNVPKNQIVYDNGANTITKRYHLKQPTNVSVIPLSILDEYNQFIYLMGGSVSITLEVTEVLDFALYESLRK